MDNTSPGAGHNSAAAYPMPTLADMLDVDTLKDQWSLDYADVRKRLDALLASLEKFKANYADGIKTTEDAGRATAFAGQFAVVEAKGKALHGLEKRPFLDAGRAADAFFKHAIEDAAQAAKEEVLSKVNVYQRAEASRLAREAAEAAAQARSEADRIASIALSTRSTDIRNEALAADDRAQQAEIAAGAPTRDRGRIRSGHGAVATLTDRWIAEVHDLAAVPREWMMLDESKVNAAIRRSTDPVREIPGLVIRNEPSTGVRV
jgi:hypothetical protein